MTQISGRVLRSHLRWMIRNDFETAAKIDAMCFPEGQRIDADGFRGIAGKRNTILMVAVNASHNEKEKVYGYVIYTLDKECIAIARLAVSPVYRNIGVATEIIGRLYGKLNRRRHVLGTVVSENNLPMQMLLKKCGFKWVESKNCGHEDGYDRYLFERFHDDGGVVLPASVRS